jgi:hypothetical protein
MVYDNDDVNLMGENKDTKKENTETLLDASKGLCMETNADKSKYKLTSFVTRIEDKVIVQRRGPNP